MCLNNNFTFVYITLYFEGSHMPHVFFICIKWKALVINRICSVIIQSLGTSSSTANASVCLVRFVKETLAYLEFSSFKECMNKPRKIIRLNHSSQWVPRIGWWISNCHFKQNLEEAEHQEHFYNKSMSIFTYWKWREKNPGQ